MFLKVQCVSIVLTILFFKMLDAYSPGVDAYLLLELRKSEARKAHCSLTLSFLLLPFNFFQTSFEGGLFIVKRNLNSFFNEKYFIVK